MQPDSNIPVRENGTFAAQPEPDIDTTPTPPRHQRIKMLARISFTVMLLVVVLMQVNIGHVIRVLRHIQPLAALGAGGLMCVVGVLAVVKWRVLLRGVGVVIAWPLSIRLTAIAFLWNLILPGGESGTLIRTTLLARQRPGESGKVWAAVVVEHLTLVTAQLLVGGGALLLAHDPPPQLTLWLGMIGLVLMSIAILITLFLLPLSAARLDDTMTRASRKLVVPRRLHRLVGQGTGTPREWLAPLWQGVTRYRGQARTLLTALSASLAFYATMYAAYWVAARSLGITLGYADIVWLLAVAGLATHLPVTVAGVGVRESILVFFLTQRHVHISVALAFSITILALNILLSIPGLIAQALHTSQPAPLTPVEAVAAEQPIAA